MMFSPNLTLGTLDNVDHIAALWATVGTDVVQGFELMYVVMVVVAGRSRRSFLSPCAGVLLRKDLVLTASSCVKDDKEALPDEQIKIIVRNLKKVTVKKKYFFPNKGYATYSLALILVEDTGVRDFPSLPNSNFNSPTTCTLSGFGSQNETVRISDFRAITVNESQMAICNQQIDRRDRICVHWRDVIACRGDVGSPLICGGAVVGVYNPVPVPHPNSPCYDRYAVMYSPVFPVTDWVNDIIDSVDSISMAWINSPWSILGISAAALAVIGLLYYSVVHFIEKRYSVGLSEILPDDRSSSSVDTERPSQK